MTHEVKRQLERLADQSRPVGVDVLMQRVERQLMGEPTTGLVSRKVGWRPVLVYALTCVVVLVIGAGTWVGLTRPDSSFRRAEGEAVDRWGLATLDLPETMAEVAAVFESMPDHLDGIPLTSDPTGGHLVEYGEDGPSLIVQVASEHLVEDGARMTPAEALRRMADADELDVVGYVVDEPVVWLHATYAAADGSPDTGRMLDLGAADGGFIFEFGAPTTDALDAIVAAFIEAVAALP